MKENKAGININVNGIITIIFIILKLTGKIAWSWWWVFSPIWIGWIICLCLLSFLVVLHKE